MDTLDKLKNCKSKFGLSKIIGIKLKKITYILFVKNIIYIQNFKYLKIMVNLEIYQHQINI